MLRKQGKLSEALRQLDEAIRLDPTAAAPWLERGMALETGGSLEAALASYQRAAELDPQSASAFGGVASIASRRGDLDIALQFGERALALDPRDPPGAAGIARTRIEQRPAGAGACHPRHRARRQTFATRISPISRRSRAMRSTASGGLRGSVRRLLRIANQATARRLEQLGAGSETHREFAERLVDGFRGDRQLARGCSPTVRRPRPS